MRGYRYESVYPMQLLCEVKKHVLAESAVATCWGSDRTGRVERRDGKDGFAVKKVAECVTIRVGDDSTGIRKGTWKRHEAG